MKRYYSEEETKKILNNELEIPEVVNQRIEETYSQIRARGASNRSIKIHSFKKYVVVAAAVTALAATSLVVLAANGFFQKEVIEEEGKLTYNFAIDYELSPNVFEVTPGYIPEGYEEIDGKYKKSSDDKGGISILVNDMVSLQGMNEEMTISQIEDVEKTTLNGLEAHVITMKDAQKHQGFNRVLLFNPEEGYVAEVFGYYNLPIEELKNVADQLVIQKIEGETAAYVDEEKSKGQEEFNNQEAERLAQGIAKEDILAIGTEYKSPSFDIFEDENEHSFEKISYIIKGAKVVDSVADYPSENFYDYERMSSCLNEDGTARAHTRYFVDEDNNIINEDSIGTKFLVMDVQAKNYANTVVDAPLSQYLTVLKEREDGRLEADLNLGIPVESENWFGANEPIYFSAPQYTEGVDRMKHFFWKDMQPQETLEYTLIYAIDEDFINDVYVTQSGEETSVYMSVKE